MQECGYSLTLLPYNDRIYDAAHIRVVYGQHHRFYHCTGEEGSVNTHILEYFMQCEYNLRNTLRSGTSVNDNP